MAAKCWLKLPWTPGPMSVRRRRGEAASMQKPTLLGTGLGTIGCDAKAGWLQYVAELHERSEHFDKVPSKQPVAGMWPEALSRDIELRRVNINKMDTLDAGNFQETNEQAFSSNYSNYKSTIERAQPQHANQERVDRSSFFCCFLLFFISFLS